MDEVVRLAAQRYSLSGKHEGFKGEKKAIFLICKILRVFFKSF